GERQRLAVAEEAVVELPRDLRAEWPDFWWLPAGLAAVILVLFIALFNDKVDKEPVPSDTASTPAPEAGVPVVS
ncbi:MAG: hypothetical protein AAFR95_17025, partial [Bacteroidota bacterium]